MASPGQSSLFTVFSELASTNYRKHDKTVKDNVSKHNALYRRLTEKGNITLVDGGLSLVKTLDYANNSTVQRYSGYDTLNINAVDVLTAAEFAWRQIAGNLAASGRELRISSGSETSFINFIKAKTKNLKRSMANFMSTDLYSDGSLANQIGGLQALVSDTGTGTVGGINSSTYPWWQNVVQSAAAPLQGGGAITPSATTIESLMLPLWIRLTRQGDKPDFIVMSDDYFAFFEQSQTSLKRYTSSEDGNGGMVNMKYKDADVFFDSSGGIPAQHAYFLNTDFIELIVHRDANMTVMDELRSVNQDAVVTPVLWMGNLAVGNRSLQGVLKA